jgi:hypothetical protein
MAYWAKARMNDVFGFRCLKATEKTGSRQIVFLKKTRGLLCITPGDERTHTTLQGLLAINIPHPSVVCST